MSCNCRFYIPPFLFGFVLGHSASKPRPDEGDEDDDDPHFKRLCTGMSLSICYAANCGGIATITGTGPNIIFKGYTDE